MQNFFKMNKYLPFFLSIITLLLCSSCYSKNKMMRVYGEMNNLEEKREIPESTEIARLCS